MPALDPARDVVEQQHEAGDAVGAPSGRRRPTRAPSTGAICTRTSWPAGRGRDEVRDRAARALAQPVVDALQRVDDEVAVEDREDRAPEADQAVRLAGRGRAVERLAQQLHRARVVEQDAALDVAHDHALRELGHQRREPVALLLDARVGLADALLDVALQRVVRVGEAR